MVEQLGPESLSTRGIPSDRRGYDRKAVDRLVAEAAARWSELAQEHRRLLQAIDEAGGLEFLTADLGALAEEIGRMLDDARAAAEGIRRRAGSDAEERSRRAAEIAHHTVSEAQQVAFSIRRQAWEEGTDLLEQAMAAAESMLEQADADVLIIRAEAEQEAHRRVALARREGSDIVRNARFEAERLVTEAKHLSDELVARAREEADAAQERTRALEGRRRRLLEEIDEQRGAEGSGIRIISSEEAGGRGDSAPVDHRPHLLGDDLAAEVERLQGEARRRAIEERLRPIPDEEPESGLGEEVSPPEAEGEAPEPVPEEREVGETAGEPGPAREPVPEEREVGETAGEPGPAPEPEPEEAEAGPEAEPEPEAADTTVAEPTVEPASEAEPVQAGVEPEAEEGRPQAEGPRSAAVADLFARLRGGRKGADREAVEEAEGGESEPAARTVLPDVDPLEIRDRRLLPIQNRGLRELKQRVVEIQNIALDALRVSGSWEPDDDALIDEMGGALDDVVEEAAAAGAAAAAEMMGGGAPATVITSHSGALARAMALDLGGRLRAALGGDPAAGQREVSLAVSRACRGWRAGDAERWAGAVVSAAYHDALLAGLASLGLDRVEGVRDGRICEQCPAGVGEAWDPGGEPPDGAGVPPVFVDCRCTVAPLR